MIIINNKGKLPVIELNGKEIADSGFIIKRLTEQFDINMDASYSPSELGIALAFQRLIEEHLYWCEVYYRWVDKEGYEKVKYELFKEMPLVVRNVAAPVASRGVKKNLSAAGIGEFIDNINVVDVVFIDDTIC